ncbi:nucleotidyltransferase family protein [Pollutimonas thiosulfatoxidans]|uniref:MobA-like NTP transferase domain-containing protein n=1 Tax=Pollutimonas thiosulfatoxidans TaxID=2028345 RepID=A0A410G9V6_9BURK|nr:nucleotidyltransferase family protein [Pollutimonas thiosulfatoxidans]QAA93098.1 hypothetical protein CKA81_04020 [Pollutimonas thiosulfatoxidans]
MKFSAIILAAGESLRMQGRHKMLLPAPVEPVVRRSTQAIAASGAHEVLVVTGHNHGPVTDALKGLSVRIIHNPNYAQGQMTSVNAGLAALTPGCDAVMVCLADQILLSSDDYAELALAYQHRPYGSILVPSFQGQRGNPVMFHSQHIPEILQGLRKLGCRKLIQDNPDAVYLHEVTHDGYVSDLDTPQDYARILKCLAEPGGFTP